MRLLLCVFFTSVLMATASGLAVRNATHVRPMRMQRDQRIWAGDRAADGEVPWLVSIRYFETISEGPLMCSGVIVSQNYVLTLASCVEQFGMSPSYIAINAGSLMSTGHGGTKHQGVSITKHENFDMNTFANDIALIEVFPPIVFNKNSYPIGLPIRDTVLRDDFALTVAGFGYDPISNSDMNTPIRKSQVTTVNFNTCKTLYNASQNYVTADSLCAGIPSRSCDMDQGGPLYHNGVLYGLIKTNNSQCGPGNSTPGLHTKISLFVDWIREHAKIFPSS